MKDTAIFRRGQVWFINDNVVNEGHIQGKSRPYVIVSNDLCNTYSSILHVAPITSQPKTSMPTHVTYKDRASKENTILIEQTTIRSIPHIIKCANYKYTLSEEVMKRVDYALSIQFLSSQSSTVDDIDEEYEDDESEYMDSAENEIAVGREGSIPSQIEKFNSRMKKYEDMHTSEQIEIPITRTSSGMIKWTTELKQQLIKDYEMMPIDTVAAKYNMKEPSIYSSVSRFRRQLSR